ncbi:ComEC/Rec2 family competence protein [Pedobacter endophyticus]|uniref:Cobyric acid synthase CobQ n=1 Tax=Pedobacter endophyticus TaxID=2789740 RepID=A0A7S9PZX1_9SPHI|nr:cobyric acid synthase CobQ [Pedobacter endophyticus]QPH40102.1 cobyric acid synthase CobQ [Pedobacter endophyticus]
MADSTKNTIKFYPVCNGDMTLITLADKTTILVDCNIRESAKGDDDENLFDVHEDLLKSLQKDADGIPFVDVFILTHGDWDHCRGFDKNFYQGNPKDYTSTDKKSNLIRVEAMWFSPMIAEEHTNTDEDAYQTEAERRLKLHRDKNSKKDDRGNRIRIIGYDGNSKYEDLDHLRSIPGDIVSRFNDKNQDTFSIFVHSPFKQHLTSATKDKNSTSIVFQARFKEKKEDATFSTLAMFGGDSDHYSWDTILKETKKSGKDKSESALNWDIFLSPHHCSWSFFNDRPQVDNKEPKKTSLEVLDYKRGASPKIIASCKKIVEAKPNPPHNAAKKQYVDKVGDANFLNTTVYEVKNDTPQPIVFEITTQGPIKPKVQEGTARAAGSAALGVVNSASKYGSGKV